MILKNIISHLESITKSYNDGYGQKENEVHKILKENNINHFYIKDQGFIVPSLKKPKKVITLNLGHPEIFNGQFKTGYNFELLNINEEKFIQGGLYNTLNIAILLELVIQNKDILNDTIIVLSAKKYNSYEGLSNFIKTLDKNLKKELIFINLNLEEASLNNSAIISTKSTSFDLIHYLKNKNINIKDDNSDSLLRTIENNDLVGFNILLPILDRKFSLKARTSLFNVENFYKNLENLLKDSYENINLKINTTNISIKKVLKLKNKKELKNIKEKINNDKDFEESFIMTLYEVLGPNINKEDFDFFVYYFSSKFKTRDSIKFNFLDKKLINIKKKDVTKVFNKLCDYEVIYEEFAGVFRFV